MRFICILALMAMLSYPASAKRAGRQSGFFFIQLADTQLGYSTKDKDLSGDIDRFRSAVASINRLKPAFVVISGDMINKPHSIQQIRAFWRVAKEISPSIPLYLVPGNHDIDLPDKDNVRSYEKLFGPDHCSFSQDGTAFIVLDSCLIKEDEADPELRAEQRKWFEGELSAARAANASHIFVLSHNPWFINNPDEPDEYFNIRIDERRDYLNLMKRFGVDWVVVGHRHRNCVVNDGPVTHVITSAVSAPLGSDPVGLRIFKVYPDRVEHQYYALDKVPDKIALDTN